MVIIDPERCCYCGGCVSVCPVDALALHETRLEVNEDCIECGDCTTACPVGALRQPFTGEPRRPLLRLRYDLVVVGAGPGGSVAAETAARAGLSVLLIEKRQEIGSPVRCAEGVGHESLLEFLEPDPRWIASEINRAAVLARDGAYSRSMGGSGGKGYILERRIFDRVLAERAALAGAEVRVKTAATGLLMDAGCVRGVRLRCGDFMRGLHELEVEAKVVIAADGVESQVGRWAGLDVKLPLPDTLVCAQYVLAGIDVDPNCTDYTIDYEIAPGGYAWVFPKGEGKANVGLGVQADIWGEVAGRSSHRLREKPGDQSVLGFLTRFIETTPGLSQGYPVTLVAGNVPASPPPAAIVKDGLMLVGDAARQLDPLTGGGILNAMQAGRLAAQVAVQAVESGNVSAGALSRYPQLWQQGVGRKMQRNYRLLKRFPPMMRADEQFVRAFSLAVGG